MDINRHRLSVHSLYIKILCNELLQEGIVVEESLKAAQLPLTFMNQGDDLVSIFAFQRLIDFARARTGKQWLGLALGAKIASTHHGPLGYLMASSANFSTALNALVKYIPLRTQLLRLQLCQDGKEVRLLVQEEGDIALIREVFLEAFMVITLGILRLIFARPITGLRLELAYSAPAYADRYAQHFDCPVQFSCKQSAIIFSIEALSTNNIMADAKAYRLADIECQNLLERQIHHQGFITKIERIILDPSHPFPTLDAVAVQLCVSKSTLIRKLAKENTSYTRLIEDIRQTLASYYLIETDLSIEQVAEKLGYEDTSNFSRTFQRWTSTTPSRFRAGYRPTLKKSP
ncbi:AraC family transcriptional regulator ligand-binding domain-containing protein [Simiduia curdlanivorans]|uniref:AraC family transcriptional regulator ligand-binding domain-containing protein n=1 Tax=Simiduia curdlanivorans TaxID=1492769 RepID=A0ABV8V0A9_9GAMM|nr:AraC family transcriptional regulator [Simiduia curdlanivorans]MDN3637845.1 AraC family transcriptional regulator ligand-binding domain-containing protein [Simiduia curdlanivorans]